MDQITEELLLSLTECKSLQEINVLSLRNKHLSQCLKVLAQCTNLVICYLQYNRINTVDLQQNLGRFKSLQKLDLSFNQIRQLPHGKVFKELTSLKILYLHDNQISSWQDLTSVCQAPALLHLTMCRNPIASVAGYRHQLVTSIPSLKALDEFIVTDEERLDYSSPNAIRFRALSSNFMKIYLPKFQENQSADQHLFSLDVEIYRIKRLYERNSPSIRIQSAYRGYYYRSKAIFSFSQKKNAAVKIQKVVRGWLYRLKIKRELQELLKSMGYLLMSQKDYSQFRAAKRIAQSIRRWLRLKRKRELDYHSATLIKTVWRAKHIKQNSFVQAFHLDQDHKICFLKEQKEEFIQVLDSLQDKLVKIDQSYNVEYLKSLIVQDKEFLMIRYPNPLTFKKHEMPLVQLSQPSYQSRVKVNNGLSKLIKGGQPVYNLYTRFSGMDKEKTILKKLKKRMCHYNSQDTSLIYQTRTNKQQSLRMRKLYDNYQELMVFTSPSLSVSKFLCQQICRANLLNENESLLLFFPYLLKRVSAAIKIQQSYRSYVIRKTQKKIIQLKKTIVIYPPLEQCFAWSVIQQRAAHCISQWWKYLKLRQRLEALTQMNAFLKTIDSPLLYIEENIYLNMESILIERNKYKCFIDQYINFDFVKDKNDVDFRITVVNTAIEDNRFKTSAFPLWLLKQNNINIDQPSHSQSDFMNNYLGLIHKTSDASHCLVKDYNEIVMPHEKQLSLNYGLNFVQVNFGTVEEAKKRALTLALLSYEMKSNTFTRMNSKQSLTNGIFLKSLYSLWLHYQIPEAEDKMTQLINKSVINAADIQEMRDKQREQGHQGFLITKRDMMSYQEFNNQDFDHVERKREIPSYFTMKQRAEAHKNKEYFYISKQNDNNLQHYENESQNSLVIISKSYHHATPQKMIGHHQHLSRREPISILNNLSLHDQHTSKQYNITDIEPVTAKSSTAQPMSRYLKQSNLTQKHESKGSTVNFFHNRKISNAASTRINSLETTPLKQIIGGSQPILQSLKGQRVSSLGNRSLISEDHNQKLLEDQKVEIADQMEQQRQIQHYSKISRREDVAILRQINQVMKDFVKLEQQASVQMYQRFNKQEKELLNDLKDKDKARYEQELYEKKRMIQYQQMKKRKQSEDRDFVNTFAQVRNLISKQSQLGQVMKMKNNQKKELQQKVKEIRLQELQQIKMKNDNQTQSNKLHPIISTVFDSESVIEQQPAKHRRIPMTAINSPRMKDMLQSYKPHKNMSQQDLGKQRSSLQHSDHNSLMTKFSQNQHGFGNELRGSNLSLRHKLGSMQKVTFIEETFPLQL